MVFDRSRFKATQVATLNQQETDISKATKSRPGSSGRLKVTDGQNKFRIYPAQVGSDSFCYARTVHWLPREIEEGGKKVISRRPVFSSKVHGGTPKCVIEEYIRFVFKTVYAESSDKEVRDTKLKTLRNWKTGITSRTHWVMYAEKIDGVNSEFGLLEASAAVKDKMNEIAIGQDESGQPISTDPFTDPDSGKALLVTYDSADGTLPQDRYRASLEWKGDYSLSDEALEKLMKADSLKDRFVDVYTKKDFDLAIDGLTLFDEDSGYGIFGFDEFLDICEEISNYYDDGQGDDDQDKKEAPGAKATEGELFEDDGVKAGGEEEEEEEEDEEDEEGDVGDAIDNQPELFSDMERDELQKHIKDAKMSIRVLKKYSDEDLRELMRAEVLRGSKPKEEDAEVDTSGDASSGVEDSAKDRIAQMRKQMSAKKDA